MISIANLTLSTHIRSPHELMGNVKMINTSVVTINLEMVDTAGIEPASLHCQ